MASPFYSLKNSFSTVTNDDDEFGEFASASAVNNGDACLQPAFSALSGGSFSLFQSAFPVNSQDPCERVMKPVMSSGNQVFFNPIPDSDDEFGDFCGPIQPASLPAMPENPSSIVKESHSDPMVVWDSPEPTPSGPNYHISLDSDILDVQLAWGTSQSDEFSQCVGTLPVSDLLLCDTIPEDSFQIVQREISTSLHATLADCDELSVTSLVLPSIMNQSTSICTDAGDLTNETDDFGDFSQASLPSLAFEEIISQRDENFIFNPIELQSACKVVSEELADNLLDDSVPFDDFQAAPDALGSARDDSWVAANFSGQDPWRDDEPLSGAPPEDKFQDEARKENTPAVDLWKEDPPAVDPWKEDPPAVDPWKEDLPDVDPWKEDPPAVDPWNEGPPAVDPWNEDPPVVDPWAEDPPVVCDDPPEVDPWGEDPPPVELWKKAPAFIDPWREDASEQDAEPEDDEFGDFAGFQTPAVDDEFDDDFDDFEVAPPPPATETVDTKHPHSVGGVGNAPAESQECRIQKLLSVIVPCDAGQIDSAPIDEDPPAPLITLCCSARGALWSYVKELESTPALSFQWRHSTAQQRLLASLKISSHPMNPMALPKWNTPLSPPMPPLTPSSVNNSSHRPTSSAPAAPVDSGGGGGGGGGGGPTGSSVTLDLDFFMTSTQQTCQLNTTSLLDSIEKQLNISVAADQGKPTTNQVLTATSDNCRRIASSAAHTTVDQLTGLFDDFGVAQSSSSLPRQSGPVLDLLQ